MESLLSATATCPSPSCRCCSGRCWVTSCCLWRRWRLCHFWLSVVYTLTNIPHLAADILAPNARVDQIVLMLAMVVIGLLINREGWLWWRLGP